MNYSPNEDSLDPQPGIRWTMNSHGQYAKGAREESEPRDVELETGEPLPAEAESQVRGKIPGIRGKFNERGANATAQVNLAETPAPGEGRMVLSCAKYLQTNSDPEIEKENRKIRQKEKEQRQGNNDSMAVEKGVFNSGAAGGLAAMGVAVVWFLVGLMNDVIFFYPPILFVIGLAALMKGLMGGGSKE